MSTKLNSTLNGTQASLTWSTLSCGFNPTAEKIGKTFAYCLIFLVSLAGNSLIGIVVYKTKTLRRPINFLIVNMAFSDLLFPIFLFPRDLVRLYAGSWLVSGPLGQTLCKLRPFLLEILTTVSIQSLVLIAVDRFGAVLFPLRSPPIRAKRCRFLILCMWIIAVAVWCLDLFAYKLVESPSGLACKLRWKDTFGKSSSSQSYDAAMIAVFWYVQLVLIAILYFAIAIKIKSQKIPGVQLENAREKRLRRERGVLKLSIAIVTTFAVCWLPLSIYVLLILYSSDGLNIMSTCAFRYFATVAFFLARSYCGINPCVCFIFSQNYRQGLKNLFGRFRVNKNVS